MSSYSFARVSDSVILDLFRDFSDLIEGGTFTVDFGNSIQSSSETHNWSLSSDISSLIGPGTYLIQSSFILCNNEQNQRNPLRIEFRRGAVPVNGDWQPSPSVFVDGLKFDRINMQSRGFEIVSVLQNHISMAPPIITHKSGEDMLAHAGAILNRVTEAAATIAEHTAERQKILDDERRKIANDAQQLLQHGRDLLEKEAEEQELGFQNRIEELERRAKEVDDRQNTHARRDVQRGLGSLVDSFLRGGARRISDTAFSKTMWICSLLISLTLAGLVTEYMWVIDLNTKVIGLTHSMSETSGAAGTPKVIPDSVVTDKVIANLASQQLFHHIRVGLYVLALSILAFTILRLNYTRYKAEDRWERELYRNRLDIERASMVVEADLEARKLNQQGLPDVLLQSFSRGLFTGGSDTKGHEGEDDLGGTLSALFGQAAKIQLNNQGMQAEWDRGGLKRAGRQIGSGAKSEE